MKKVSAKEFLKVLVVLCVVLSFSVPVSADEGVAKVLYGRDVETIYDSIRHSAPEYEWEESIVSFENEGMTLVCSVTIPVMSLRPPIVITLNGFTGTRDELPVLGTGAGMFKRTAQVLAAHGFASLRIDFRGSGDSDGEYDMMTFSTQISDAIAAIDYVQNYLADRVNPRKIGVIGLSQGGLVGSVTASKDKRVDSLVLWSPPPHAPIAYEGILSKEGVKQGLELPDGGAITLGIYIDGAYLYDVTLGKDFFKDLFAIDPLAEIQSYKRPLMVIGGLKDVIVWPQPASSEAYLKYHHVGAEKLVVLDADHTFDCVYESEKLDDAAYWSTAWFIKTLRR